MRGGEGKQAAVWASLAFFFFCFGIHFLSLMQQSQCVCCLGRQKRRPVRDGSLLHAYFGPPAGKARVGRIFCLRNGGL